MSECAVKVENLSKSYLIRDGNGGPYLALRDVVAERAGNIIDSIASGKNPFKSGNRTEEFLALKDISFEVMPGEVMGIVGKNGAGKSTLLKVLSRITEPSKGKITLNGRVASLLEVGTGFHPELTGRENIYLSGAILGMTKKEIKNRFDEIVDFAGVEKFLYTPVKRYSSGMFVRLGFSVAAHLETEILLIDEVLAVGDAEFQEKCLGKMDSIGKSGKTILFVSHNLGMLSKTCNKGLLINNGELIIHDVISKVIQEYQNSYSQPESLHLKAKRKGSGVIRITDFHYFDPGNSQQIGNSFISGQKVGFRLRYTVQRDFLNGIRNFSFGIAISSAYRQFVTVLNNKMAGYSNLKLEENGSVECVVDKLPLMFGKFHVDITVSVNNEFADHLENASEFFVEEGDYYDSGFPNVWGRQGVYIDQKWNLS